MRRRRRAATFHTASGGSVNADDGKVISSGRFGDRVLTRLIGSACLLLSRDCLPCTAVEQHPLLGAAPSDVKIGAIQLGLLERRLDRRGLRRWRRGRSVGFLRRRLRRGILDRVGRRRIRRGNRRSFLIRGGRLVALLRPEERDVDEHGAHRDRRRQQNLFIH